MLSDQKTKELQLILSEHLSIELDLTDTKLAGVAIIQFCIEKARRKREVSINMENVDGRSKRIHSDAQ